MGTNSPEKRVDDGNDADSDPEMLQSASGSQPDQAEGEDDPSESA
jgi:hypothetical protein